MMKKLLSLVISCVCLIPALFAQQETSAAHDARMRWWRDARFGMFIHWGLYAVPAGEWKGETGYGEWIRTSAQIPLDEYDHFREQFNPLQFNAEEWVRTAKEAGMKYIVITSKHHDGFCMFDTKQTDFSIMKTPFSRDPMKELAEACRKYGLKFCFYYSIMDWHHPDYLPRREWETNRPAGTADYEKYVAYMKAELKELLSQYGDIGVLWFDGEWEGTWNQQRGLDLYKYVRGLEPQVIINNRVGAGRLDMAGMTKQGMFGGDFGTPEQEIPATGLPGADWETCMTMNDHWGYNSHDKNFKSTKEIIRMLADIASKGGNFLLNVGPTALGTFPEESSRRLKEVGQWMEKNSEAIYETQASPAGSFPWGRCTMKTTKNGLKLYLHVFEWPAGKPLVIPGCLNEPRQAYLLADKNHKRLTTSRKDDAILISLPGKAPDTINTVVVLDLKGTADFTIPPEILSDYTTLIDSLRITLSSSRPGVEIRYTLTPMPSEVDSGALIYKGPFFIRFGCSLNTRCYRNGKPVSATAGKVFTRKTPYAARAVSNLQPGLSYRYYEGKWDSIPDFKKLQQWHFGSADSLTLSAKKRNEFYAFNFSGFIRVPKRAVYRFTLSSDDGSKLFIEDRLVINNDKLHPMMEKSGEIALMPGYHKIRVEFFQKTGDAGLELFVESPGLPRKRVNNEMLFHE